MKNDMQEKIDEVIHDPKIYMVWWNTFHPDKMITEEKAKEIMKDIINSEKKSGV